MDDNILVSIKRMLGIEPECKSFDQEITFHINSTLSSLIQLGVTLIRDRIESNTLWDDILDEENYNADLIKDYLFLKVRSMFDPPTTSFLLDALKNNISELEWRIYADAEGGFKEDEIESDGDNE